jgi:hypothetical protein
MSNRILNHKKSIISKSHQTTALSSSTKLNIKFELNMKNIQCFIKSKNQKNTTKKTYLTTSK